MYEQLKLENQLCFRFYTVSRLITQAYQPLLMSLGITYPQYLVLLVLWEKDRQPVNDIAKRLMLNTNTVTPLLQRMESEGIVKRSKNKEDARKVIVSLTEMGKSLEDKAASVPTDIVNTFSCDILNAESGGEMIEMLDTFIRVLTKE